MAVRLVEDINPIAKGGGIVFTSRVGQALQLFFFLFFFVFKRWSLAFHTNHPNQPNHLNQRAQFESIYKNLCPVTVQDFQLKKTVKL